MGIAATPYSSLKIFAHPEKLEAIKRREHTAPMYIRIKPTNACNQKCYYCSYADDVVKGIKHNEQIPWDKMREIIQDLGMMGVKAVTFSGGGDPLVYPHILHAMEKILEEKIDLSIITNGQKLNGEIARVLTRAKWVRISLDSADAQTYARTRQIPLDHFDKICNNISDFAGMKSKKCELGINFVVNHENAEQVYDTAVLVRGLGVNHVKFTARNTHHEDVVVYHEPFKKMVIEQIRRAQKELTKPGFKVIDKYEDDFKFCVISKRTYSRCVIIELVPIIAADSRVYFCHDKAYFPDGLVGDLKNQTFKQLWFSPEVIERFRNFDARKECQHHCAYDDRNMLINSFLSLDEEHINFI